MSPSRGDVGQVDVDLVDAAILDVRGDRANGGLEQARIVTVRVEVDRQQDRIGCQRGRLHHAHRRMQAQRARFVRRRRDDAAPRVATERRERAHDVVRQRVDVFGRLMATAAADDDGFAAQLGIAQELDRRVERIHVEMCDERFAGGHRSIGRAFILTRHRDIVQPLIVADRRSCPDGRRARGPATGIVARTRCLLDSPGAFRGSRD